MRNNFSQFLLLITGFVFVTGCKTDVSTDRNEIETKRMKGQIFVVQKNRHNVRLGAVEVRLVDRDVFDQNLKKIAESYSLAAGLASYEQTLDSFKNILLELQGSSGTGTNSKQAASNALNVIESYRTTLRKNSATMSIKYQRQDHLSYDELYEGTPFEENSMHSWCLTQIFHAPGKDLARQITTTDADGRFSLEVPIDRPCLVLAKASRALTGDDKEHFYWIYDLSSVRDGELMLSNPSSLDNRDMSLLLKECGADTRMISSSEVQKKFGVTDVSWLSNWMVELRSLIEAEQKVKSIRKELEYKKEALKVNADS